MANQALRLPGPRRPSHRSIAVPDPARSSGLAATSTSPDRTDRAKTGKRSTPWEYTPSRVASTKSRAHRSEEHTSELQSRENLVCRLLLEKKQYMQQSN